MSDNPDEVVELSDDERALVVERKATCPFIGAAILEGHLLVRNGAQDPLASVEDVRRLGNSGGGHLGDVLILFANGNHAFMRSASGQLDKAVPDGLFSLDFPGSQGSHSGHSGILQGAPGVLNSGRLSEADFQRLIGRALNGLIKRSEVGCFIADNVFRDPKSTVIKVDTAPEFIRNFFDLVKAIVFAAVGIVLGDSNSRGIQQKFTKLAGMDNLVGSAGEFGLLFAFLANKPNAEQIDAEPALSVEDLKTMFVDRRLPDGWETWNKSRVDWVKNTIGLLISARREYNRLLQAS